MSEKDKKLAQLTGFLNCLERVNSFADDEKTYIVKILPKGSENISTIIQQELQGLEWTITASLIQENWKNIFKNELIPYFAGFVGEIAAYTIRAGEEIYNIPIGLQRQMTMREFAYNKFSEQINDSIELFNSILDKIVLDAAFYKVDINCNAKGWHGVYASDYVFDLNNEILLSSFKWK